MLQLPLAGDGLYHRDRELEELAGLAAHPDQPYQDHDIGNQHETY